MTATTPKQTAGNNPTLARVKEAMNGPIYKLVMDAYNAEGREAARAVLASYVREAGLAAIFDGE